MIVMHPEYRRYLLEKGVNPHAYAKFRQAETNFLRIWHSPGRQRRRRLQKWGRQMRKWAHRLFD